MSDDLAGPDKEPVDVRGGGGMFCWILWLS